MIRIFGSLAIAMLFVVPAAWVAGFDFDHRGEGAFVLYLVVVAFTFLVWGYPGWSDWEERRRHQQSSGNSNA